MERILSESEKIRRAEEIYLKRKYNNLAQNNNEPQKSNYKTYVGSKIILEMVILILTVVVVFVVKNRNFIFSNEFLEKLSCYNIDLTKRIKEFLKDNDNVEENNILNSVKNTVENISCIEKNEPEKELIKPINGIITSEFGIRNFGNEILENHTGIDIASNTGEKIISASKRSGQAGF